LTQMLRAIVTKRMRRCTTTTLSGCRGAESKRWAPAAPTHAIPRTQGRHSNDNWATRKRSRRHYVRKHWARLLPPISEVAPEEVKYGRGYNA
jgi:hypothetical protein